MSVLQAEQLVADDEDFDDEGFLKEEVKDDYEDKYSEVEYLDENDNYDASSSEEDDDDEDDDK
jgi:hypothetical protein